jgi:cell division protein FtsI/penicillin-binding protein 2
MQEQNFQMSGDIDDNSAVLIGKLLGANIVITGTDSGSGNTRRLRLTAINAQTGEVVAMASERF